MFTSARQNNVHSDPWATLICVLPSSFDRLTVEVTSGPSQSCHCCAGVAPAVRSSSIVWTLILFCLCSQSLVSPEENNVAW